MRSGNIIIACVHIRNDVSVQNAVLKHDNYVHRAMFHLALQRSKQCCGRGVKVTNKDNIFSHATLTTHTLQEWTHTLFYLT